MKSRVKAYKKIKNRGKKFNWFCGCTSKKPRLPTITGAVHNVSVCQSYRTKYRRRSGRKTGCIISSDWSCILCKN